MEDPIIPDPNEKANYWKRKADEYRQQLLSVREELDDFQISSRELELELETQLEQLENRNKELSSLNEKLTAEKESYQNRVLNNEDFINHEITRLQEELQKSKYQKEEMHRYIRELEQVNDDLERSQRTTMVSLEDFESRLNQAIERNAFLENELDEKADLLVTVQRLKDETRDLHQELAITRRQREPAKITTRNGESNVTLPSASNPDTNYSNNNNNNSNSKDCMIQTDICSFSDSAFLSPTVRLSALTMVNDALQKIGQLEAKLSVMHDSCNPPVQHPPMRISEQDATNISNQCDLSNLIKRDHVQPTSKLLHNQSRAIYRHLLPNSNWLNGSASVDGYRNLDPTSVHHPLH